MARWTAILAVVCVLAFNTGCQSDSRPGGGPWLDSFQRLDDGEGWLMEQPTPPAGTDRPQVGK
jgi:hypothetical protein